MEAYRLRMKLEALHIKYFKTILNTEHHKKNVVYMMIF